MADDWQRNVEQPPDLSFINQLFQQQQQPQNPWATEPMRQPGQLRQVFTEDPQVAYQQADWLGNLLYGIARSALGVDASQNVYQAWQEGNPEKMLPALGDLALSGPIGPDDIGRLLGMAMPVAGKLGERLAQTKLVNKVGQPQVFYHGSGRAFDEFSQEAPKVTGGGLNSHGFSFSPDPKVGSRYATDFNKEGGMVYPVYLNAQNPVTLSAQKFEKLQTLTGKIDRGESLTESNWIDLEMLFNSLGLKGFKDGMHPINFLKDQGVDAIQKLAGRGGAEPEVLVFQPNQIVNAISPYGAEKQAPTMIDMEQFGRVPQKEIDSMTVNQLMKDLAARKAQGGQ